jgi:hypothetical protein
MRKLKLDVEQLTVESFAADAPARGAGTVDGHSNPFGGSDDTLCDILTCAGGCDGDTSRGF